MKTPTAAQTVRYPMLTGIRSTRTAVMPISFDSECCSDGTDVSPNWETLIRSLSPRLAPASTRAARACETRSLEPGWPLNAEVDVSAAALARPFA